MSILNNFRSSRRMHTKRRGGAGDNECDICLEPKTTFDKLNCKNCSDKGSKICKECAGIIKIQKKNCPMCRGEIQHSFTSLRDKIAARKKVKEMEQPVSSRRTPVSSRRTPVSSRRTPVSPRRTPVSPRRTPVSSRRTPVSPRRTPVSSRRTPVSSRRTPVSSRRTPASAMRRPAPRRDSPNTERANRTRRAMANNPVMLARTAASAASRTAISRNRI